MTKEWLYKIIMDTYVISHIQNAQKDGQPMVRYITTVASSFNRNIPNTVLRVRHPRQVYLQPKELHLHDCGGSHIHIGESMSSPPQYIIWRPQQYNIH
jgi:hypothetical protein